VDAPGKPFRGISYIDGRRRVNAPFRSGVGRGVRRTALHAALLDAAKAAGVQIIHDEIGEVTQDASSVRAGDLRARYLAAADGLHSPIRESLCLAQPTAGPRRWGIRRHFQVAPWTEYVEVHWGWGAEAYVTPVADDWVGIAILTSRRADSISTSTNSRPSSSGSMVMRTAPTVRPARCARRCAAEPPGGFCWSETQPVTSTR
jgi:2-polyprenyl-6-methoxyphenol hydroxylase-like FAD-dependent oxidoreductase